MGIGEIKNIEMFLCFNIFIWNNKVYRILMFQNYIKLVDSSMFDIIEKINFGIFNVRY